MMTEQEVIIEVAKKSMSPCNWEGLAEPIRKAAIESATKTTEFFLGLFKQAGYVLLDEDQELPTNPFANAADRGDMDALLRCSGYYCGQDDMVKGGFHRIKGGSMT